MANLMTPFIPSDDQEYEEEANPVPTPVPTPILGNGDERIPLDVINGQDEYKINYVFQSGAEKVEDFRSLYGH